MSSAYSVAPGTSALFSVRACSRGVTAAFQDTQGPALLDVKSTAEADWHLFGDYFLANPLFLALVPVVLVAFAYGRSSAGREAARVSALPAGRLPRTWVQRVGPPKS